MAEETNIKEIVERNIDEILREYQKTDMEFCLDINAFSLFIESVLNRDPAVIHLSLTEYHNLVSAVFDNLSGTPGGQF